MMLDYFYGQSGELFSYFRIPKALFAEHQGVEPWHRSPGLSHFESLKPLDEAGFTRLSLAVAGIF